MVRVVLALTLAGVAVAQFTSSVNQIEVYASVTDAQGRPVRGLQSQDFEVLEDGVPQQISVFAEGDFPLAAAVAVDSSFSMTGERLNVAKSAARIFLGALRAEDQSMLMSIGGKVSILSPLSSDRQAQFAALNALRSWGTTSLHDAIIQAIDELQPAKGRRALVLLSDGDDRYSAATTEQVVAHARRADVMVYPVALGRSLPPLFTTLAQLTGGRAFHQRNARKLPETLRAIADELRQQYLIGYAPSRPFAEPQWRDITVRVSRPRVTVRTRDGYFSPGSTARLSGAGGRLMRSVLQ